MHLLCATRTLAPLGAFSAQTTTLLAEQGPESGVYIPEVCLMREQFQIESLVCAL